MSKLDELTTLLRDGEWHNLSTLAERLETPLNLVEEAVKFLAEKNLIHYDEESKRVKINQAWSTLFVRESKRGDETEKAAIGTIIIPDGQSILIQHTRISNLTGEDLELEIKVKKRLREITITKLT